MTPSFLKWTSAAFVPPLAVGQPDIFHVKHPPPPRLCRTRSLHKQLPLQLHFFAAGPKRGRALWGQVWLPWSSSQDRTTVSLDALSALWISCKPAGSSSCLQHGSIGLDKDQSPFFTPQLHTEKRKVDRSTPILTQDLLLQHIPRYNCLSSPFENKPESNFAGNSRGWKCSNFPLIETPSALWAQCLICFKASNE